MRLPVLVNTIGISCEPAAPLDSPSVTCSSPIRQRSGCGAVVSDDDDGDVDVDVDGVPVVVGAADVVAVPPGDGSAVPDSSVDPHAEAVSTAAIPSAPRRVRAGDGVRMDRSSC